LGLPSTRTKNRLGESKDILGGIIGNATCKLKRRDPWEVPSVGPDPTTITHYRGPRFAIGNVAFRATKLSLYQFRTNLQLSKHSFILFEFRVSLVPLMGNKNNYLLIKISKLLI
jgi:hypothetical protein